MNPPVIARVAAYALSAGAHVAVMAVTFGHPAPARSAADVQQLVDAPSETPVDVVADTPAPEAPRVNEVRASNPTPPTHTHPYPVAPDHDAHPHDPNLVHLPFSAPDHDDHDHDHDPPPVVDAPAAPAHFTMVLTTGSGRAAASAPAGAAHGSEGVGSAHGSEGVGSAPMAEAAVSVPARLVGAVTPVYPPAARQSEIEADVGLEIIVAKDGRVVDARVTRPAGYGFDDAAIHAVLAARFTPALHDGVSVPVRMHWNVSFRLR